MTHFKLFSCCKITKGYSRAIVSDLQRIQNWLIPSDAVRILEMLDSEMKSIQDVILFYGTDNKDAIFEYLDYFIENDLGFYCELKDFEFFLNSNENFELPNKIHNAVLENFEFDLDKLELILNQLHKLGCDFLYCQFYCTINLEQIKQMNAIMQKLKFISFELTINFDSLNFNQIIEFFKRNENKLSGLTYFNAPFQKTFKFGIMGLFEINYIEKNLSDFRNCGIINTKYFLPYQDNYLESINHNSCLHKKISIDKDGYIRNCPSMPQHFGNIKDTSLEEALNHPDFKKYWNVTKDMIDVCKDCEFRHICTDCRAYTERTHFEEDIDLSKPLKCGYNPYTNEWAEWSTNPLKQKAIEYYGMQELVKKDV